MFIRIKKIKNYEYAYKVKNSWSEKGARQKVVGYLGRVLRFDKVRNEDFSYFIANILKEKDFVNYLDTKSFQEIAMDLPRWELYKLGFNKKGDTYKTENATLELKDNHLSSRGKDVVIALNDGFLCGENMRRIKSFNVKGDEEDVGIKLAEAFVEAGIGVPKDVFVKLFEKYMSK